jgi:hypothetical protein
MDKIGNSEASSGDIRKRVIAYLMKSRSGGTRLTETAMDALALIPVMGTSMLPSLRPGDIIAAVPFDDIPPAPGETVLLKRDEKTFVVHRVLGEEPSSGFIRTGGDSRIFKDPPVRWQDCAGRVIGVWRDNKMIGVPPEPLFFVRWTVIASLFLKRLGKKYLR